MEFTFPLLLLSILVLSAGPVAPTPIRDSHGNPVLYGARYYLTASTDGNGVGMASFNGSCPSTVFLQTFRFGPPVMLFPLDTHGVKIRYAEEEEDLYIMFAQPYHCDQSTQWKISEESGLVTTGGHMSDSFFNYARFRIVRYNTDPPILGKDYYEIWSCPSGSIICSQIGVRPGPDQALGRSDQPLPVLFTKVPEELGASTVMHPTA